MTVISQKGNDLFCLLSMSSTVCMKLTMGASVICGSLLRIKFDFCFFRFVNFKLDIIFKLRIG